jgi:hypothetical protein
MGRSFLTWCGLDLLNIMCIGVLPGTRTELSVVHGRVRHVGFGLVEAHVHHLVKHWDVGGRWEMQGLGRCGREQSRLATHVRLVGVMSRGHVIQEGRGGAAMGTGRDGSKRPVEDAMFML